MTDFRALCAELLLFAEQAGEICEHEGLWPKCDQQPRCVDGQSLWLLDRARLALAKPAPNYDRVAEIATEGEIRAAAQYLIKKQNCDGDLIPAIKYAIARWGHPQRSSPEFTQEQLQLLSEILWACADEGPPGAGWASESLKKLREDVDSAMSKPERWGPTD